MQLLQEMTFINTIVLTIGSLLTGTGIGIFLLKRYFFRKMDRANVDEKLAMVRKIGVETEISISAESLRIVSTLRTQLDSMNKYQNEIQEDLNNERRRCEEQQKRIDSLQKNLDKEKETCKQMAAELEQLKIQVKKYEQENRRRPNH